MIKHKNLYGKIYLIIIVTFIIGLIILTKVRLVQNELIAKKIKYLSLTNIINVNPNKNKWNHTNRTTILVFFNSSCQRCHYEIESINRNLAAFNITNILFVSDESVDDITAFSKTYQLDKKENIWWLKMHPEDVYDTFGAIGVPHIWIYNKEGKLVKEFKGETKVEAILEWL